jgi:hypothetical protein
VSYSKIRVKEGGESMPDVDPAMPTYRRFLLAAELLGIAPQELARRLDGAPRDLDTSAGPTMPGPEESPDSVDLHARYLGHTIEAVFERSTGTVTITSGELAGSAYTSPSRAAIAVVTTLNPEREAANTNGRLFWIVTETGRPLRSLLGRR